jgi:hypothetical protein
MKYATIVDNEITKFPVSEREWLEATGVSTRKWTDCSDSELLAFGVVKVSQPNKPIVSQRTQIAELSLTPTLVGATWSQQWVVSDKSVEEITDFDARVIKSIKREASKRIIAIAPEWKQSNMLARSIELLRKGETNLTADEIREVTEIDTLWDEVKRIRSVSDTLEAMEPPPEDYADDKYWIV